MNDIVTNEPVGGCPCRYVEPCMQGCSCAKPFQSNGCLRCCGYGNLGQRKARAEQLADILNTNSRKPLDFIIRVLQAFAADEGAVGVWWRTDGEYAPVTFFTNNNDEFYWATADGEEITPENIDVLEQAVKDCRAAVGHAIYAGTLFACRIRGMRPQGAAYPKDCPGMWPLLDAAGPVREPDALAFGNPYPAPTDKAEGGSS